MSAPTRTVPHMPATTTTWAMTVTAPDSMYGTIRDRYVNGECHGLALAIHRLTGWTAEGWVDQQEDVGHCYVRVPDGRLLDIDGLHDKGWPTFEHDENDDLNDWGDYDPALAMHWARRVLDAHQEHLR